MKQIDSDDDLVYDEVSEAEYQALVRKRQAQDDFVSKPASRPHPCTRTLEGATCI